jgi:ATP-dependent helicase STH1/SNF2
MTRIFHECYNQVEEATEEDEEWDLKKKKNDTSQNDNTGAFFCRTYRIRSELFMDLVDKRDYPLYYTMIKSPISMNMIKKRMNSTYYRTIAHFRQDFHTMFNNARIFNEEGSYVYEDANELQVI